MDDVLCDFKKSFKEAKLAKPDFKYPQSELGFFEHLDPIEGGVEAVHALIESKIYDPYILTAPSIRNPLCYMEKRIWIEKYFGLDFVNKLIISPNKGLLKGQFLIDDNIDGKGQENFEGKVIHFGSDSFPDWVSIRKELAF